MVLAKSKKDNETDGKSGTVSIGNNKTTDIFLIVEL